MNMLAILNKINIYMAQKFFSSFIFKILVKLFKITAKIGYGSNLCLKNGFLPLPVHFFSPIPDIEDLERRKVWDIRSLLGGIDFRKDSQISLIKELGFKFSSECQWPLLPPKNDDQFYLTNPSFSYGCAASTHCMIRHFKPKTFIEIGSGMSSLVISKALAINRDSENQDSDYTIIDPYPSDSILKSTSMYIDKIIKKKVETVEPTILKQLCENDILFIDSSHCVRIGGDVNYLILDILPILSPGVIIHFHDIAMPYEYSKVYATKETFRQFWTEQYLLQSFLCFNSEFEILLALNYIMRDHNPIFKKSFPFYNPELHPYHSGSFWIRRKTKQD